MGLLKKLFGKKEPKIETKRAYAPARIPSDIPTHVSDTLTELRHHGKELGFPIETSYVGCIPEIVNARFEMVRRFRQEFISLNVIDALHSHIYASVSFYAGVAAVALWNKDKESIDRDGVINTILNQRGFDRLDEWVLEKVLGYNDVIPDVTHPVGAKVHKLAMTSLGLLMSYHFGENADLSSISHHVDDAMIVMYIYGMQYQMCKLGMC